MSLFPTPSKAVISPNATSFLSVVPFINRTIARSACLAAAEDGAVPFPSPLLSTAEFSATLLLLEHAVPRSITPVSTAAQQTAVFVIGFIPSPPSWIYPNDRLLHIRGNDLRRSYWRWFRPAEHLCP